MAVYWIGQDNNIWYKDENGTRNMGPAGANAGNPAPDANGFYDPWADPTEHAIHFDAQQIADPMVQQQSAPSNPNGGVARPVLNRAAVDNTQRSIDQIAPLLQAALEAEGTRFSNAANEQNNQEQSQRGQYGESTTTNQKNYDANFMDSIRAGIKGLGGLMALLRGTGAAGGSVDQDVRNTVGGVTSNDIRQGADTQKENQTALDASLSSFLTDLGVKRRQNEDTRVNNERAYRRDSNTQLQDLYGKMAGYYGDAGDSGNADRFMRMAGDLTPEIAANSRTQISPYDTTPVAVQAPKVTAFAGPTQPNVLAVPSDGQVGSGIFTMTDNRRRKDAVPAGA